jgi:hypothetical protein
VTLGNLKCKVDFGYIEKWKSRIFAIETREAVGALPNDHGLGLEYPDQELRGLIHGDAGADITIGIINAEIEGNYYERALSANTAVISLYQMDEILEKAEHRVEHFILRCLYSIILLFKECNGALDMETAHLLAHDEVRNCLFDMNIAKADVIYSLDPPTLCDDCKARLSQKQLDSQFIDILDSEMKRIRKALFFRAADWTKAHPLYALLITVIFGWFIHITGSLIYDGLKGFTSTTRDRQSSTHQIRQIQQSGIDAVLGQAK